VVRFGLKQVQAGGIDQGGLVVKAPSPQTKGQGAGRKVVPRRVEMAEDQKVERRDEQRLRGATLGVVGWEGVWAKVRRRTGEMGEKCRPQARTQGPKETRKGGGL
jgi:hypothetical protein